MLHRRRESLQFAPSHGEHGDICRREVRPPEEVCGGGASPRRCRRRRLSGGGSQPSSPETPRPSRIPSAWSRLPGLSSSAPAAMREKLNDLVQPDSNSMDNIFLCNGGWGEPLRLPPTARWLRRLPRPPAPRRTLPRGLTHQPSCTPATSHLRLRRFRIRIPPSRSRSTPPHASTSAPQPMAACESRLWPQGSGQGEAGQPRGWITSDKPWTRRRNSDREKEELTLFALIMRRSACASISMSSSKR